MARTPDGPPPPPPVQRIRLRFAKRGRLRFTSHRDFQRAFERAVRRAGLPIAFSAGFSPHPRISYAGASPTGAASEAEYLELALTAERDPAAVAAALDAALPPGLDILDAVTAGPGSLADRLQASRWRIDLPGIAETTAADAVDRLLAASEVTVERLTKNGLRRFDARGAVLRASVSAAGDPGDPGDTDAGRPDAAGDCAILTAVIRHQTPAVRPDDLLAALRLVADLQPAVPPRMTRLAQGPIDQPGGEIGDPLAPDRG